MAEKIIIDAENAVMGRLASFAAKKSLQGIEVSIVNSEKAIILGSESEILKRYFILMARGGKNQRGPIFPSTAERILKRTIRGMLPIKHPRGKQALKSIKCYVGIPKEFEGKKMIKSAGTRKGMPLEKLARRLIGQ